MKRVYTFSVILLVFSLLSNGQTIVYQEGFEGTPSVASAGTQLWGLNTTLYNSGTKSYSAHIVNPGDSSLLSTTSFSTTGNLYVLLEFSHICKIEFFDEGTIWVSNNNGTSWTQLTETQYLGSGGFSAASGNKFTSTAYTTWIPGNPTPPNNTWWKNEVFNISNLVGNSSQVMIKFVLKDMNNGTLYDNWGWVIDDIKVTANIDEMIPPAITLTPPLLPDTVYHTGPFQVFAEITDFSGIDTAVVVYTVNSGTPDTIGMAIQSGNIYTADIPSNTYNSLICYHVLAWDGSTFSNMGRYPQTGCISFKVKQPPQLVTIGTGTSNSTSPGPIIITSASSTYLYSNHISIFTPAELNAAGIIESMAWNKANTSGYNLGNATLRIYLKHTTITSIPSTVGTFTSELSGATLVYQSTTQNLLLSTGWQTFMFNMPNSFNYNGNNNLMVLVEWYRPGNATGGLNWYYTTATGMGQSWSSSTNPPNYVYGTNMRPNIQIGFQVTNYQYDVGISQIIEPTGTAIAGTNPVRIFLKNHGTDTITKATINYTYNGQSRPPYIWTGTILPYLSSNAITLGNELMSPGSYSVKAWASMPNDSADQNPNNDTAVSSGFVCLNVLNGTYTVGNSPTADFPTITDAITAVTQCGMSGPVVFSLLPGIHQTQMTFQNIPGTSAINTITFRSSTMNPNDVVIKYNATGTADNFVLKLDGARYLNFEYLTFQAENTTYGNVIYIANSSFNNKFTGNKIIGPMVSVNSTNICLVYSPSGTANNDSNHVFRLNRFYYGSYGFLFYGASSTVTVKGIVIDSNQFINQYYRGIDLRYHEAPVITSNYIYSQTEAIHGTANTYYYGMYLNYCQNEMRVEKNTINAPFGTYGIYVATCTSTPGREALFANNMISEIGGFTFVYGFYLSNANYHYYYHNSVNITSPTSNAGHAFYLASGSSIQLLNNIFANTGGAFCVYISAPAAVSRSNYNNLFSVATTNWGYWNGTISNLNMWKSASGVDTNSVSINPGFTSPSNLHVSSIPMNNLGTPAALVPVDFDWDVRSLTTPDIGADEYTPPAKDLLFTNVLWPRSSCALGSQEEVRLLVRNNGTDPVTSFTATYKINNLPAVTETFNKNIPPLTTDTLKFLSKANMSAYGLYNIQFYTSLPNDENLLNDTINDYLIFNSHNFYDYDYFTSFEIDDPVRGPYSYIDGNNDNSYWHFFGNATTAKTGMIYMGYECNQSNAGNDWFFTRCFTFEANRTYELSFWYRTSDATYSQSVDVKLGNATTIASMTTNLISLPGFSNAAYQQAVTTFSVPVTGVYYLGFYASSPPVATTVQVMACIDDMTIKLLPPFDAGVIAITEPHQGCGLTYEPVTVKIKNFGTSNIVSGLTASYRVDNHPVVTEVVTGILLTGDTINYTFNTPVNLTSVNDTAFVITTWTNLPGDTLLSSNANDTATRIVKSFSLPDPPVVYGDTIASGNTAMLTATSSNTVYWYDDIVGAQSLAYGNTYITPPLFANKTYYAEVGSETPASVVSGTGTSTQYNLPFYGYYEYGWSAFTINPGSMGYIDSIGFEVGTTTTNYQMPTQRIYMALVHDSVFSTSTKPDPAMMTLVFNGTINYSGPGFQMIRLATSFFYDPDYVLLVYYENQKGSTSTGYPSFRYTTTTQYQAMYRTQNSSFPNLDGYVTYNRPNLRFFIRQGTGCRSTRVPAYVVVNLPPIDAGVSTILSPMQFAQTGSSKPVVVEVKNYGQNQLTTIPVSYQLNNLPVVSQNWAGTLTTGQTDTISFPVITIPAGFSTLKAWTALTGDGVILNDSAMINILGTTLVPLSFWDNFDAVTQFTANTTPYTNWQVGPPSYGTLNNAYSSPNSWCTNLQGAYYINAEAILTSPLFDFSNAVNANLGFWMSYNSELGYDGMFVEFSLDNGLNWSLLGVVNDTNGVNWYNTANLVSSAGPAWSGNSQGWQYTSFNLNQFTGMAGIRFRFKFMSNGSGNYEGFCIDDFSITIPAAVDAAVSGFFAPQQNKPQGQNIPVVVKVKNMGSAPLTGFAVSYSLNAGPVQTSNWSGTLSPGNVAYVSLPGIIIPAGYYNICAWVNATGDMNTSNDTLCNTFYGKPKFDVAAVQIVSPVNNQVQGMSVPVKVLIRNYGVDTLTSIPVGYRINGGNIVTTTYAGVLYPNAIDTAFFPAVSLQPGQQFYCAFTQLSNDFNPGNDTVCKMMYAKPLLDVSPVALHAPTGNACNTAAMQVAIRVRNNGDDTINFSLNPCTVTVVSTGTNPTNFNPAVVNSGTLPPNFEANVVVINNYNMNQAGVYTFSATTSMPGDGDATNNGFGPVSIGGVTIINSFPRYENFETGYNSILRMEPAQNAGLSVTNAAGNGSQYGLHFQGGNPLGWIGDASGTNATTYQQAWTTNAAHHANAVSCNINASGLTSLKLRFDLRQTYSTGAAFSWFRVKVNNQVIANQNGDTLFNPTTPDSDPWVTQVFDLTPYVGTTFMLTLQSSNKNPYQYAGTAGDNALVDNIMLFVPSPNDAGVSAIIQPTSTSAAAGTQVPVEVKIENFGSSPITSCQVGFQFGNQSPVFETWSGNIPPGSSTQHIFTTQGTVLPGIFMIKAFTNLSGDTYNLNDTSGIEFLGVPLLPVPYSDDMEGVNYWVGEGPHKLWEKGTPSGITINYAYSGTNAWVTNPSGFYTNNADEYLMSPYFDFSNTSGATLRFYHWLDMQPDFDGAQVQYSLNSGQTWINIGYIMDPNGLNWYSHNINGVNCFSGISGGYALSTYNLSFLDNNPNPVRFRFRFFSNSSVNSYDGWAIDNFSITVPAVPVDAGVIAINSPVNTTEKGGTIPVEVRIKNLGTDPLTNIPVSYKVGNLPSVSSTWTGTLAPGAEVNHSFTQTYTGPVSPYTLYAFTSVAGDPYKFNDTAKANMIPSAGAKDVTVKRIIYPKDSWPLMCDSAKVVVVNAGYQVINSLTLKYLINNNELASKTWSGTLQQGDSMIYTFDEKYTVPLGTFTACITAQLTNDVDTFNNKLCKSYSSCYIDIDEPEGASLVLYQNIPNPSNGNTIVEFRTDSPGKARFFAVDLLGRAVIVRETDVASGDHTIELHHGELSPGFYLYGIEFKGKRLVKKMVVQE